MNKYWQRVESALYREHIETITHKLAVGGYDCYFKIGWHEGRSVHVDITIGTGETSNKHMAAAAVAEAREAIKALGADAVSSGVDPAVAERAELAAAKVAVLTNEAATLAVKNARAAVEVVCRHASALLQANVWTLEDLITAWRATAFEPSGVCPELQEIASSPLDAAARLCERRRDAWTARPSLVPQYEADEEQPEPEAVADAPDKGVRGGR
jgi:hypothetical protein